MLKRFTLYAALLLTTGCQALSFSLANFSNDSSRYTTHRNIAYGEQPWQKLDVYTPKVQTDSTHPVVVFFYGGGWVSGKKQQYQFVADTLVSHGFVVVIPDYIKYPAAKYPAFVEDAATASAWVAKHVDQYGGDIKSVHVMGHSAGAHIGAMLIADERFLAKEGLKPTMYKSFVGLAGPYDFVPKEEKYKKIFGPAENYPAMQATRFIDGTDPPMLLLHGADDDLVWQSNLDKLSAGIQKAGGKVETKIYPDIGHMLIMGTFSPTIEFDNTIVKDTVAFLRKHNEP